MDCHHLAKFGGHRYCSNRYVFSLSRDQPNYVIKGSWNIATEVPEGKSPTHQFWWS